MLGGVARCRRVLSRAVSCQISRAFDSAPFVGTWRAMLTRVSVGPPATCSSTPWRESSSRTAETGHPATGCRTHVRQ
jgi:hypothetical protein